VLAPVAATLGLAGFGRAPDPATPPEAERLVLRSADGQATVILEPTADGGFRIRAGRVERFARSADSTPSWTMQGGELALTPGAGAPALLLRDPTGRVLARLGAPRVSPSVP
jgi:hypothetical protein